MADLKISQLTAITTLTPATDVLPVVDVTGTTRKITTNQILGSGGTATLASATITGDLTVRTNKLAVTSAGVGFGTTTPVYPAHFRTTNPVIAIQDDTSAATGVGGTMNFLGFTSGTSGANIFAQIKGVKTAGSAGGEYQVFTSDSAGNSVQRYLIDSTGVSTWSVSGSTAMTLNSTGLGIGAAAGAFSEKLRVYGAYTVMDDGAFTGFLGKASSLGASGATTDFAIRSSNALIFLSGGATERMRIDSSGNVGIGVTPITSHILSCAGPVGITGTLAGSRTSYITNSSAASIYYTDGGGSGYFTDFGNLIIQPRTSAARSVVIATGSTTPVERAVVKSTGQVRFVPLAADPAGAEAGDVYYNSVSNRLKYYNGTAWTLI